ADELRRAIGNLLTNVRVHTDADVPCAVRVECNAGTVSIVVADRGSGMSAPDAASAFDRFFRSDSSRSRASGGSGLGLAIAKAVVDAHRGTITLDAAPGNGTIVTIVLPRAITARKPATNSR